LQRLDHRVQTPGVHVLWPFLCETLEAFGRLMHRTDMFLADEVLSRCGTDHLSEPSEVGRAPMGPAHLTAIRSQPQGVKTELGVCEIAEGIVTRPGAIAPGFSCDRGDRDGGAITCAGQAGEWHRIPAVGVDAVAGLLGDPGGGDDPAVIALFGALAGEPGAAGAGLVDEDAVWGLRWHLAEQWIEGTLTRADGPKVHDLGAVILSHVRHSDGVLVHSHANEEGARLRPG
jgi:hypothetical protein